MEGEGNLGAENKSEGIGRPAYLEGRKDLQIGADLI
jgi:hypothetical protein